MAKKKEVKETPKAVVALKVVEPKKVDPVEVLAEKIYIANVNLNLGVSSMTSCAIASRQAASTFVGK